MNNRNFGKFMTLCFIFGAVGVLLYGFPYHNIWTFVTGMCLWLLAVANSRINELSK